MAEGWVTVQLRRAVKERLEKIYTDDPDRPETQKFTNYLDNLLSEYVDYREQLKQYGAFIEFFRLQDNHILLQDSKDDTTIVTVQIRTSPKKELYCEEHKRNDCYHVGFCYNVKKVYERLIAEGFKPPRR
jgi:hypothetical protein